MCSGGPRLGSGQAAETELHVQRPCVLVPREAGKFARRFCVVQKMSHVFGFLLLHGTLSLETETRYRGKCLNANHIP